MKSLTWIVLCAAICLIASACKKTVAYKKYSPEAATATRLNWNMKTLVDAYQKDGHTSPSWDDSASAALTEFARARSRSTDPDEDWTLIISNKCSAAVEAGCDDPMVRYLYVRNCMSQTNSKRAFVEAYCKAAQEIERSSYPGIRKFYAWLRAGQQVIFAYGYGTKVPQEVRQLGIWQQAELDFISSLSDQTMPSEEVYEASREILEAWKGSADDYSTLYQKIEAKFPKNWKSDSMLLLLNGEASIQMAWQARGSGYASTVTSDGWKLFHKRLDAAAEALTEAWQINTNEPRIPLAMMTVALGKGLSRDQMELWFQRAMALDTNNYDACAAKLNYLKPKWFGSVKDMLAFGRECAQNEQWGGHIPLILMDAHVSIQQEFADNSEKDNYWKQPEVWRDLKNAFDRFFVLNPKATGWYSNYAWYAYEAEQWAAFNALVPKIEPVDYAYFGGKDRFEIMLALAKKHAAETKAKD